MALVLVAGGGFTPAARAEVRVPKVFSSHMVLQQDKPLVIWGWAQPNEKVTVELATGSQQAQANERGEWKAVLPAMKAGGPYTLTVSGSTKVQFEDVMIGEVWLCSGQSNMEMGVGVSKDGKEELAAANYPGIRLLNVTRIWKPEPQNDIEGAWKACTPQTLTEGRWGGFSACGYYFGRELHKKLRVVHSEQKGWGRAVRSGLKNSRGDILCYVNAARTSAEDLVLVLFYAMAYPGVVIKACRKIRASMSSFSAAGL